MVARPNETDELVWVLKDEGKKLSEICRILKVNESFVLYSYQIKRRISYVRELEERMNDKRKDVGS